MFPSDLAIFSPVNWIIPLCIHSLGRLVPARGARLGGLVLVMGEDEVGTTAVDVEANAEELPRPWRSTRCASPGARGPRAPPRELSSPGL